MLLVKLIKIIRPKKLKAHIIKVKKNRNQVFLVLFFYFDFFLVI